MHLPFCKNFHLSFDVFAFVISCKSMLQSNTIYFPMDVFAFIFGSSVQCADAFRIALTGEPAWFIQRKHSEAVNCLFCHHPPMQRPFQFNMSGIQTGFWKTITPFQTDHLRKWKTRVKSRFVTSIQSIGYWAVRKRCLIGLQKGVGNTLKEHRLQVNQASLGQS